MLALASIGTWRYATSTGGKAASKQKGNVDMEGMAAWWKWPGPYMAQKTPRAILAGGTASFIAKEMNIPLDTTDALEILAAYNFSTQQIDMGLFVKN